MTEQDHPIPELVAHRGYAARYPENTVIGIEAALKAGARWVEFDVQVSADGVPVLHHDDSLRRTTGVEGAVSEWTLDRLRELRAGERTRFGSTFEHVGIPTLDEVVAALAAWPDAGAFVEIKRSGLAPLGLARTVARVLDAIEPIRSRAVVISFEYGAVEEARATGATAIGWVIRSFDAATRSAANALRPEYLLCRRDRLPAPPGPLWAGPWRWAAYDAPDTETALDLAARGVALVETMCIGELLGDPRLVPGDAP